MEVSGILAEIDAQISKLQQARELLSGTTVKVRKSPAAPGTRTPKLPFTPPHLRNASSAPRAASALRKP